MGALKRDGAGQCKTKDSHARVHGTETCVAYDGVNGSHLVSPFATGLLRGPPLYRVRRPP